MLLYDIPVVKESLSTKCIGGLFTRLKFPEPDSQNNKNQQWCHRNTSQMAVAKSSHFQLYTVKASPEKQLFRQQRLELNFIISTPVFGVVLNMQSITLKVHDSLQTIDLIIVTLNSGELVVFHYSETDATFRAVIREVIFKDFNGLQFGNARHLGNYIAASELNHFMVGSVRGRKKLYSCNVRYFSTKNVEIKIAGVHQFEQQSRLRLHDSVCWDVIWLPPASSQSQYLGKYVSIQKEMTTQSKVQNQSKIIEEGEESSLTESHKTSRKTMQFYYVHEKGYKVERFSVDQLDSQQQSAHLLLPVSCYAFFILCEGKIYYREFQGKTSLAQPKEVVCVRVPNRHHLVNTNVSKLFTCFCKQQIDPRIWRTFLIDEFGDVFKLEYSLSNGVVGNFVVQYVNTFRTAHSIVYVGQVDNGKLQFMQGSEKSVSLESKHEQASVLLFGLERFNTALCYLVPIKDAENKPKEIKATLRHASKSKKSGLEITENQTYKPPLEKAREIFIEDELPSLGAIMETKVFDTRLLSGEKPEKVSKNREILTLTSGGNLRHAEHFDEAKLDENEQKSHLQVVKKGLKVTELNSTEFMKPYDIYVFKKSEKDTFHRIIVLCMYQRTVCLSISNENSMVISSKENLFDDNCETLFVGKLEDQTYVQVSPAKIRHIRRDKEKPYRDIALKSRIVKASCQGRQLFVALFGGEICYYELEKDGLEYKKEALISDEIVALSLTPLEQSQSEKHQKRSKFLMVCTKNFDLIVFKINRQESADRSDKESILEQVYKENLKTPVKSICATLLTPQDLPKIQGRTYCFYIGLQGGSLIKMRFNSKMQKLQHKMMAVGAKPVNVSRTSLGPSGSETSVLIQNEKIYIHYIHNNREQISLVAYPHIESVAQIKLEHHSNCLLAYSENRIRFLAVDRFGKEFHEDKVDLVFSGKKMVLFNRNVGVVEADPSYENLSSAHTLKIQEESVDDTDILYKSWKSQFTIYRLKDYKRIAAIYFSQEICISAAYNNIRSGSAKGEYLIFGCADDRLQHYPKIESRAQSIKIYHWNSSDNKHSFLYSLSLEEIPAVIEPYQNHEKFLVAVGRTLKLFEIAKKKLLLKGETKNLSSNINQIRTFGHKVFVTSVADSFHLLKFIPELHTFYDIAEDLLPRFITTMNVVDADTVCAADKFGNIIVGRLTENAKTAFDNASSTSQPEKHCYKFNQIAKINLGSIVTSILKTRLYTSQKEVILYSTVLGQLRALCPLTDYQDATVLPAVEKRIKAYFKIPECVQGNNYGATTNTINGDLIEAFLNLDDEEQSRICEGIVEARDFKRSISNIKGSIL